MMYVAIPSAPRVPRVPLNGTDASAPFDWAGYASKAAILAGVYMMVRAIQRGLK